MPVQRTRTISLEHHLALATLRNGHGNLDQIACLIKVVYLAFFLRDVLIVDGDSIELYRRAEWALHQCILRLERKEKWRLLDTERSALERVIARHDEQLAVAPSYRYRDAWHRLNQFLVSKGLSPIPR